MLGTRVIRKTIVYPFERFWINRCAIRLSCPQSCGSGSAWIRINLSCWIWIRIQYADPDPDPGGQNAPQKKKKVKNVMFWIAGCSLLRAEGFFSSLGVLYRGLGISNLPFLIKKYFFSAVHFFKFLVIKTQDPDPDPDPQLEKRLDPEPY